MNILPCDSLTVHPHINRYFNDMEKWHYDVAYCAFYAFPLKSFPNNYDVAYIDFVKESKSRKLVTCIQIQSTVVNLNDVSETELQYYVDNKPYYINHHPVSGTTSFGSFASLKWLLFLLRLTKRFHDYGFDWIVYEEPMYRTDIPGTKDRFYRKFKQMYPQLKYPTRHEETAEYLTVQILKQDLLIDFYRTLVDYAKKIGFTKTGIMPWFFAPTIENTAYETRASACDIGRIINLPNLDFVVVRMQPDNIYAGTMLNNNGEAMPKLAYLETLAHNSGKPVISVNNPTNEHILDTAPLIPIDFFIRYTLSLLTAAPNGMSRHWYGANYDREEKHMAIVNRVNQYLNRLGNPDLDYAFVFSYRGTIHAEPDKWPEVWQNYWSCMHRLLYEIKKPGLTIYTGSIKEVLTSNPQVKTLILNEYFPCSSEDVRVIEDWFSTKPGRNLIFFGSGQGYDWNPVPGKLKSPPAILGLFGITPDFAWEPVFQEEKIYLKSDIPSGSFWGKEIVLRNHGYITIPENCIQATVLYREKYTELPVITRYKNKMGNQSIFCGLGLKWTLDEVPVEKILSYFSGKPKISLISATDGILWNLTRGGYLVITNSSNVPGKVEFGTTFKYLWDVQNNRLINIQNRRWSLELPPFEFKIYRNLTLPVSPYHSRLLDVDKMVYLTEINDTGDRIKIMFYTNDKIQFKLTAKPNKILLDTQNYPIPVMRKETNRYFSTEIQISTGDHQIELQW